MLHPFLLAVFPILFLYGVNIDQDPVLWQIVILLIAIVGGASLLIFSLLNFIIKDNQKSGLITSIFFILFYSYGRFNDLDVVQDFASFIFSFHFQMGGVPIGAQKIFLLIWTLLILAGAYLTLKANKSLNFITKSLNLFFILLVFISLITIGANIPRAYLPTWSHDSIDSIQKDQMTLGQSSRLPDIYYIILDMYASSNTLRDSFGFDNGYFEEHLKQKGFFIANASRSNYGPHTMECLACYLNMDYLDNVSDTQEPMLFEVIQNNTVARVLKSKGYAVINIGSGWGPTAINRHADLNLNSAIGFGTPDQQEFLKMFIRNTMLRPLFIVYLDSDRSRVLGAFSRLEELPDVRHPKFVLAHFMSPHYPYIFGKNGEKVPDDIAYNVNSTKDRQLYLNQLIFINYKLEHLIDSLLAKSEVPPIIIIQSDHGPRFDDNSASRNCDLNNQTLLEERTTIFNAYYIPGNTTIHLYDSITPVNSFRLIFNSVFGTHYSLLSDRSYYTCGKTIDVTDKLRDLYRTKAIEDYQ